VVGRPAADSRVDGKVPPKGASLYDRVRTPLERRRPAELLPLCREAIALIFKVDRRTATWTVALQLITSVGVAAQLLIARHVVAGMLDAGAGNLDLAGIGAAIAALTLLFAILSFADTLSSDLTLLLGEKVGRRAAQQVTEVSTAVDLEAFERAGFYDRLEVARFNAGARNLTAVRALVEFIGSVLAALAIGGALLLIEPLLVLMVLVAGLPSWLAASSNSRDLHRLQEKLTSADRERNYLLAALTSREQATEVRSFDVGGVLAGRLDRLYDSRIQATRHAVGRRIRRALAADVARALGMAGTLLVLLWMLDTGRVSLASAGAAVLGLLVLAQRLRTGTKAVGDLYEAALFLDDVADFMKLKPALHAAHSEVPPPQAFERLDVRGLSFTYPGATQPAIDDVSLSLEHGEVVALVGENGSGKTTLAKVLSGLYAPQRGHIYWDGTDVLERDLRLLCDRIAVLFQDYVRWALPAGDNVGFGRHERMDDHAAIRDAAARAGADDLLSGLPKGYETVLSRLFSGGRDLSGGQWQRVALARALFRDAPLLILDEPTAALDPVAEARLFAWLRELMRDRTVLFISHRFSSVRLADRIYVLDAGRVVEHGTHDELVMNDGRYAHMFRLQAAAYLDAERV
jgi:ATP-binding cassette subfamily B protein